MGPLPKGVRLGCPFGCQMPGLPQPRLAGLQERLQELRPTLVVLVHRRPETRQVVFLYFQSQDFLPQRLRRVDPGGSLRSQGLMRSGEFGCRLELRQRGSLSLKETALLGTEGSPPGCGVAGSCTRSPLAQKPCPSFSVDYFRKGFSALVSNVRMPATLRLGVRCRRIENWFRLFSAVQEKVHTMNTTPASFFSHPSVCNPESCACFTLRTAIFHGSEV